MFCFKKENIWPYLFECPKETKSQILDTPDEQMNVTFIQRHFSFQQQVAENPVVSTASLWWRTITFDSSERDKEDYGCETEQELIHVETKAEKSERNAFPSLNSLDQSLFYNLT